MKVLSLACGNEREEGHHLPDGNIFSQERPFSERSAEWQGRHKGLDLNPKKVAEANS